MHACRPSDKTFYASKAAGIQQHILCTHQCCCTEGPAFVSVVINEGRMAMLAEILPFSLRVQANVRLSRSLSW